MIITTKLLKKYSACEEGFKWVVRGGLIGLERVDFIKKLIEAKKYSWANWLFCYTFNSQQVKQYVCFALDKLIEFSKEKFPKFNEKAIPLIEAMKALVKNPTEANRQKVNSLRGDVLSYLSYPSYLSDRSYLSYLSDRSYRSYRIQLQIEILNNGLKLIQAKPKEVKE